MRFLKEGTGRWAVPAVLAALLAAALLVTPVIGAGTGVTANAVLPGPTRSEGVEEFVAKLADDQRADPERFRRDFVKTMRPSSLIGRFAETKEVANLVVFLCGEGSSAITGASLRVDGGVVRSIV